MKKNGELIPSHCGPAKITGQEQLYLNYRENSDILKDYIFMTSNTERKYYRYE